MGVKLGPSPWKTMILIWSQLHVLVALTFFGRIYSV